MIKKNRLKFILLSILFITLYIPTFQWMKVRFLGAESYYTHGFLVPFIFFWLIHRKKEKLRQLKPKPALSGLFIFLFGILIHLSALVLQINFISGFSLLIVLFGMILYLGGKEYAKELSFPVVFLIFMMPLPFVLIINTSFKMKILAAQAGTAVINWLNIPAHRAGSIVQLPNTVLTIGSPCSGLRSLIALTGLGALFAYVCEVSKIKKIILFLSAIPLALLSNVIRIVALLWVAYVYGQKAALGKFHDYSGIIVFVLALGGLFAVGRLLKWKEKK